MKNQSDSGDRMQPTFVFALSLSLIFAAGAACSSASRQKEMVRMPAEAANPQVDGAWGPPISLRAPVSTYANFPKVMERPDPSPDGWWIAPIHASVLADGDVLINGWARPQEKTCPSHMGRQWPASFLIHIPAAVSSQPGVPSGVAEHQFYVQTLDEAGDKHGGADPMQPVDVLYCSGHVPLPDGKILFTGGARYTQLEFSKTDDEVKGVQHEMEDEYGLNYARIFDPQTSRFHRLKTNLAEGPTIEEVKKIETAFPGAPSREWSAIYEKGMAWYPTNLRLPDGRVLMAGGFARQSGPLDPQFVNRSLVIFDPKKMSTQPWTTWLPHQSIAASRPSDNPAKVLDLGGFDYVHLFLLPRPILRHHHAYTVAILGGVAGEYGLLTLDPKASVKERLFIPPTVAGSGPARPMGKNGQPPGASDTTGVLLPSGEIVMVGGGFDAQEGGQRIDVYNPYTNRWRTPIYTGVSRIRATAMLLPTGEVLVVNGEISYSGTNIGDRRQPLLYDPATHAFRLLSAWTEDPGDRGYHNFAVVLKDARVLLGGGRELVKDEQTGLDIHRIGCEKPDLRLYSPPYLYAGERPVSPVPADFEFQVGGSAKEWNYNGPELKKQGGVVLMALPSETHHFDQNQRQVLLRYRILDRKIRIEPPYSRELAPIGLYTLYFVSEKNVPSEGISVRVQ